MENNFKKPKFYTKHAKKGLQKLPGPAELTLNEFEGKKVSVYFSNSKHSQQSFAAPRS